MYYIPFILMVCITPKNGMLSVRRDFIPKKYVMHTFVLTVHKISLVAISPGLKGYNMHQIPPNPVIDVVILQC